MHDLEIMNRLKEAIHMAEISHGELCRRIKLNPSKLSLTLSGGRRLESDLLAAIALCLNVSVNWLLFGRGPLRLDKSLGITHALPEDSIDESLSYLLAEVQKYIVMHKRFKIALLPEEGDDIIARINYPLKDGDKTKKTHLEGGFSGPTRT